MTGLVVPEALARLLVEHARAELPGEACALLAGDRTAGLVTAVHPARNALASPYRYEVDPQDLVRIVHDIDGRGADLVAIFHSHPAGPAVPSAADVREARWPALHLVASLAAGEPELRAWRIENAEASEVALAIA